MSSPIHPTPPLLEILQWKVLQKDGRIPTIEARGLRHPQFCFLKLSDVAHAFGAKDLLEIETNHMYEPNYHYIEFREGLYLTFVGFMTWILNSPSVPKDLQHHFIVTDDQEAAEAMMD